MRKILSNFTAVAMLTGAAVVGVGAGGAGVATALTPNSSLFNATDGTLGASDLANSIDVFDKVAPDDTSSYGSTLAKEDNVCPEFSNSAPGKADLEHFYVGKENTATDTFLYLAWSRLVTTGTVTIDFELNKSTQLQSDVDPTCANPMQPVRTEGDLLFTYDFQGTSPFNLDLSVRTWDATKKEWRAAVSLGTTNGANSLTSTNIDASINADGTFGEMALNLTGLGLFDPQLCENFATAFAKSRSSNSFTSSLQDLTDPSAAPINVSNCRGVTPKKVDDKNQPLAGASFSLLTDKAPLGGTGPDANDTLFGSCGPTTLPTGTCTIPNVKGGSYWLVETTTPNGYATAPPQLITVPAGAGPDVTATFVDNPVPGSIDLTKVDAQTQAALQGAQFGLFTDASPFGTAPGAGDGTTAIATCTSNANGLCSFSNVAVGHYWVKETLTPNGYDTVAPIAVNVPLGAAANTGTAVHIGTVGDNEHPGSLRVVKTDGVNGDLLDGAVFKLVHDAAPTGGSAPGAEDTTQVGTCTTGATGDKGACTFGNLALGQYWVIETTAPVGFGLADPAFAHVTIGLGGAANQGDNQEVSFPDPRLPMDITIVKSVNGNSSTTSADPLVVEKGSTLDYKVVITNTGDVALTIGALADTLKADLPASCTQGNGSSLAPGASFTCTYSSTAAVPSGGGLVVNTASVSGTDQFGRTKTVDSSRHVRVLDPAVNIAKAGPNGTHVGEKVTYTLTVTNPGNTSLSNVVVTDSKCDTAPAIVGKSGGNQDDVLDVSETWTYTCDHTVVSGDGAQIVNTATVTGKDVLGTSVTAKSSHTVPVLHPAIAITKSANPTSANPGQTVVYTYTVTNPGDTSLSTVGVTDDKCSPVTFVGGDTNGDAQLNVDETWTFTCSNTASSTGGDNTNVGTTTGVDRLGKTVTASASATITVVLAEVIARQLPFTGSKTGRLLTMAVMLMMAGLFFYLGGARLPRRREQ